MTSTLLFQEALLQFQSKLSTQLQLINRAQNKQLHTQQSAPSAAHALPLHPTPPMLPQGIETLSLRMDRHVENATKVAKWLEADDRVDYVTYAGLESSPYFDRVKDVCPRGASALFTFAVKGGYDACIKLVDALEIFSHVANLGDARSLIIHSASTTHRQLTAEQQEAAGAGPGVVRVSIGLEDADDLIADLDQALAKATS